MEIFGNPIALLVLIIIGFVVHFIWRKAQRASSEVEIKKFYNATPVPFVLFARTFEENTGLLELAHEVAENLEEAENGWNPPIIVIPFRGVYQGKSLANMSWAQYQVFCSEETIRIHQHWQQAISGINPKAQMSEISGMKAPTDFTWDDTTNRFSKLKPVAAS